jgi:1,4-alpha-glucan branching enzyme
VQQLVSDLNKLYLAEPGLWQADFDNEGFEWIDASDNHNSVMSYIRREPDRVSEIVVILNLTPVARHKYRIGLPRPGKWFEVLNTDAAVYGGSNVGNFGSVTADDQDMHNQSYSAEFTLPPMSIIAFKPEQPYVPPVLEEKEVVAVASPTKEKAKPTKPAEASPTTKLTA